MPHGLHFNLVQKQPRMCNSVIFLWSESRKLLKKRRRPLAPQKPFSDAVLNLKTEENVDWIDKQYSIFHRMNHVAEISGCSFALVRAGGKKINVFQKRENTFYLVKRKRSSEPQHFGFSFGTDSINGHKATLVLGISGLLGAIHQKTGSACTEEFNQRQHSWLYPGWTGQSCRKGY